MKSFINKLFLSAGVLAMALSMSSCVDDLDQTPSDPRDLTADQFKSDPMGYMNSALAALYFNFASYGVNGDSPVKEFDGGMATWQRAIFILSEIPSDEAGWNYANDGGYDGTLPYGIVTIGNGAIEGIYSRFSINVTLANNFIRTVREGYFGLDAEQQKIADDYCRQAEILRCATYFYWADLFGNPPYADSSVPLGGNAPQIGRAGIYERCVESLETIVALYEKEGTGLNPAYGYVGREVAEAMLVKFYLNAEVWTGKPAWDKCYAMANQIINRHKGEGFKGSGLVPNYGNLFAANNKQYAPGQGGVNEILWTIPQSVEHIQNYANSTFLVNGWISADFKPACNTNSSWGCMAARRQFVDIFDWQDEERTVCPDTRVANWVTAKYGVEYDSSNPMTGAYSGKNGYWPIKYCNWNLDDNGYITGTQVRPADLYSMTSDEIDALKKKAGVQPQTKDWLEPDYAQIRLAEIYLSAAEAALHGGGSHADALAYVNIIRERAGLQAWNDVDLPALQLERQRELYTENTRRNDLVRYGKWCKGYTWDWKGGVPEGTDFPAHYNLYPIPAAFVTIGGLTQNPGY